MAAEALRSVFADFGFAIDVGQLDALNDKVDAAASDAGALADAVREAAVVVDAEYEKEAKAAEAAATKTAAASKTMADAAREWAAQRWGVDIDTKSVEQGSKRATDSLSRVKATAETALGQRLFAQVSKLSRRWRVRQEAGRGQDRDGRVRTHGDWRHPRVLASLAGGTAAALAFARLRGRRREAPRGRRRRAGDDDAVSGPPSPGSAGVSAETMTSGLNTLATGLRAIESRSGGPTGALWRLGVRARDTAGRVRDTQDVMEDLADRFERVQNPIHRARLAQELSAPGPQDARRASGGSAALRAARQDLADLGGGMLPEATEASRRFASRRTAWGRAQQSAQRARRGGAADPDGLVNRIADLGGWVSRMVRGSNLLQVALAALGSPEPPRR